MRSAHVDLLAEVGAILGSAAPRADRAVEVLAQLRTVVPYAAASITALPPAPAGRIEHTTLANDGYSGPVEEHLNDRFVHQDPVYLLMRSRYGPPLRWRDAPFSYRDTFSVREVFVPAGFDEGVTVCLHNRGGRYTGSLHVSVDDHRRPTDEDLELLVYLRRMLGTLADLGPAPPPMVTGTGPASLSPPSAELVRHVRALAARSALPPWFFWRSPGGDLRMVTAERVGSEIQVTERAGTPPYGLSLRELEVLVLVANGQTNTRIAHTLRISPKTVAKHVENILSKMDVRSRTEAAVRAARSGLVLISPAAPSSGVCGPC
ncbi:MAG TPA: LuxR C-terminal-related transcriptional regulator [Pseudonocardiaceae bacterium]|nr:LuxR C-terminal-related transcriptional regulator [Pseudonocardiaceae bacterium]